MVRSVQGSKIKNIRNLVIDCLEDLQQLPAAICVHVGTNDIDSGKGVGQISAEMEDLVIMIQKK